MSRTNEQESNQHSTFFDKLKDRPLLLVVPLFVMVVGLSLFFLMNQNSTTATTSRTTTIPLELPPVIRAINPELTERLNNISQNEETDILDFFVNPEVNVVVVSKSDLELDRFTIQMYLKRLKLLQKTLKIRKQTLDSSDKIEELYIQEL
ncbi:MAG: hypothetical protein ACPG49_07985 [Chitinophagales bacterium]